MNKILNKIFFLTFLLLPICFFTTCSDSITGPARTWEGTLMNQRSINVPLLSEMTEDECVEFIIQNGVIIPPHYTDLSDLGVFVKKIIQAVEDNPNYPIAVGSVILHDFINSIKIEANMYG